ncbi:diphthine synthase [Hamiltosporidium magnivora]|uniref:diphthine methyl ester synthase n=1 Tax=Hamiltosporidium magnivora TaxID=148818 RepID=A0A4Q9L4T9_9MICR|nr:diphthine synthase [Hamiltosporidium magnivora]
MLYIIGLGLSDEKDISVRGLEIVRSCEKIYLENYTSLLKTNKAKLEELYGKEVEISTRNILEKTDLILEEAKDKDVALLVIGTPLFATTHTDIILRSKEKNVKIEIIHNSSIMNVMGCCGLFSYSFGRTVSIPYFTETWKPTSFYEKIYENFSNKLHTLCLLDLRVDEKEEKYMQPNIAIDQILESENILKLNFLNLDSEIFVVSRFGCPDQNIIFGKIRDILMMSHGNPLHSLIIPSKMEIIEKEHVTALFG